jgi:hypothetical protein
MRIFRVYRCDFGHQWTVMCQQGDPEEAEDTCCPEGHEAVTCNEELPADEVQVLLRPAARIVDRVTEKVWLTGRYFLVLFDRTDRELCVSKEHYTWDQAIKLAGLFKGKPESRALAWWKRKAP